MFCHRAFVCGTGVVGGGGTADLGDCAGGCIRGIIGAGVGVGIGLGGGGAYGGGGGVCGGLGDGPGAGGGLGVVNNSIILATGVVGLSWSDDTRSVRNKASCIPPAPAASAF